MIPALHKERWVCAFIPFENNYEELLCNDVMPVVNQILKEDLASNFIYRREGEEKLALYFRTTPYKSELEIKPRLFNALTTEKVDFRDFCILYFGTGDDADIAEILLPLTSKIISALIKEAGKDWNIETAIEKAIPLHLALVHAFEMPPDEISAFYQLIIEEALDALPLEDVAHKHIWKTKFTEGLDTNYQAQKEALIGYTEYLLSSFENNDVFDEDWINTWVKTCLSANVFYKMKADKKQVAAKNFRPNVKNGFAIENQYKWPLLMQFVRFINAQMGMELIFEFNLLYALKECTKQVAAAE